MVHHAIPRQNMGELIECTGSEQQLPCLDSFGSAQMSFYIHPG
jgi:hypothetical protein